MENLNEPHTSRTSYTAGDNGKLVAILSYMTLVGWLVALVMHNAQKTALGAYHLRQSLLLFLAALCAYAAITFITVVPLLGWLIGILAIPVVGIGSLILWVMGLVAAVNGEHKPIPVIGEKAQEIFKDL
ncbi:MAG: hypothetical protein ICV83_04545 [Cytophagales bacterium]|nr:hypothetical protein [Cytophagales bacterium]